MAENHQERIPKFYTWTGLTVKRSDATAPEDVVWIQIELLRYRPTGPSNEYEILDLIVPKDRILSDLEDFVKTVKEELEK